MADAMMMFLGEAHGVNWYWAQPGEFENPGVYYWDGAKNVLCVPHLAAAPEAPAGAVVQKAVAWVPVHPKSGPLWAMTTDSPDPERLPAYPLRALYYNLYDALTASPEAPAQADAFNPFAGHSIAVTKQTAYGEATAYFPELPEASAVDERAAGVFSEFNACMHRETCRAALAQKGGAA